MSLLAAQLEAVDGSMPFGVAGQVQAISGMTIEACELTLPLGSLCRIHSYGGKSSTAEVIGFREDATLLMPLSATAGISRGDRRTCGERRARAGWPELFRGTPAAADLRS